MAAQGFAVGIVWVPITAVAFGTLDPKHYAEASAVFHLLRNIGSSFFISICVAEVVRAGSANYSRLVEMVTPLTAAVYAAFGVRKPVTSSADCELPKPHLPLTLTMSR